LTILFLFPFLSGSLEILMHADSAAVRYFPPFWFLGIYESLLAGQSSLPVFVRLAHTGYWATSLMIVLAIVTYPLAYKRKTRQSIEGSVAQDTRSWSTQPFIRLLHATALRTPSRRAVYHFISQTLLRAQHHRVYLSMYAGLGAALITACTVVLRLGPYHLSLALSPHGLRLAVPALAFWTVAGLRTALVSPTDSGGGWVFRVIHGRPAPDHLVAAKIWVLVWAMVITLGAVAALHLVAPPELRGGRETFGQVLVAGGLCLLLTDVFFLQVKAIPFTEARVPRNTDLAFVLLRYIVLFPALVLATAKSERWIVASGVHLMATTLLIVAAHGVMFWVHRRIVTKEASLIGFEDGMEFPYTPGLRD
jgi:hypothetical protein